MVQNSPTVYQMFDNNNRIIHCYTPDEYATPSEPSRRNTSRAKMVGSHQCPMSPTNTPNNGILWISQTQDSQRCWSPDSRIPIMIISVPRGKWGCFNPHKLPLSETA